MAEQSPAREARLLLRAARAGTLATRGDPFPLASLITPATAPDGSVLMLLSSLSEHTKQLQTDPRCAVMVAGQPDGPNAQTAPRLTLQGTAAPEPDPALRERWIALHPYAAFYAGFADFALWRLRPERGHFVGGFARAFRLERDALRVHAPDVEAAEARVIAHCNEDHADALAVIAAAHGHAGEGWRMVACDADGFDLASHGDLVRRIPFTAPVDGPAAIRTALVEFARAARNDVNSSAGRGAQGSV